MALRRVAVTGLGALTPIGNSVEDYAKALYNGVSGAAQITRFDASKFRTQFACEVKDLQVEDYIHRKEVKRMDPFVQYALIATEQAIQDSGLDLDAIDKDRTGVIWGSGIGGLKTFYDEVTSFNSGDGTPRFNPFFIPKMIVDLAPGHISMKYGFRGVNYATVSACASASNAIGEAYNYIRYGKADIIISGGSEAAITEPGIGGFNSMKALSERNDDPKTASRPFDKDRDGFVMGEGAGCLILEELESAKRRGAKIYAEVVGFGVSADAHHMTAPHPEGIGATMVMKNALEDAGLKPQDVGYINVHGTSTPLGDIAELKAIQKVFGDHAYNLNISSTKSMTGHLLGAAGAIEGIASIVALNHDFIPPSINHSTQDDQIDPKLNLTLNEKQERRIDVAISNTFGFGGHNASIIVKRLDA